MSRGTESTRAPMTPAAMNAAGSSGSNGNGHADADHGSSPMSGGSAAHTEAIRDLLAGKHVCPFCGAQRASAEEGCPRCTMEDTTATRQATKSRIGPWYVLQTRNPSAPGMKYSTLLALVAKGQVSARSIVRGPTTHQLWRFAAHVRGLSRVFGICYSCGEALARDSARCPHCERSQEPPSDPDQLLEPRGAISPAPASEPSSQERRQSHREYELPPQPAAYPPPPARTQRGEYAERLRMLNSGEPGTIRQQRPDPARRDNRMISGMDLASALHPDVDPYEYEEPRRPRTRSKLGVVVLLLIIGGGVFFYLMPEYREQSVAWVQARWNGMQQWLDEKRAANAAANARKVVPQPNIATPRLKGGGETKPNPQQTDQRTLASSQPEHQPVRSGNTDHPNASPASASGNDAAIRSDAPPPSPAIEAALENARKLRDRAIDAESRNDFAEAVRLWEEIKRLPRDAHPPDLQVRLNQARAAAKR